MPDYSLVPVDHQPDFDGYSLMPVDHDPFAADGLAQQAQFQLAQAQPQLPAGAGRSGVLNFLHENGRFDSHVYEENSAGTPPAGPQATTVNRNIMVTATDNAGPTNFGGVYGRTLTFSEPGSNNLKTVTAADPTGLLVATPVEGDPNVLSAREYKGY